jgi:hypothetical protein
MANHMPVDLAWQRLVAGFFVKKLIDLGEDFFKLLNPVFAKLDVSQADNLLYGVKGGGFGNDDELDLCRVSARAPAGGTDIRLEGFDTFSYLSHKKQLLAGKSAGGGLSTALKLR